MLKNIVSLLAVAVLLCGCAAKGKKAESNKEVGFTPLFNGQDLSGWTYGTDPSGKERKAGAGYQVREGGVVYCTVNDGGNLFTEREYGNFALRFEFKLTPGANNGVAIRSPRTGSIAYDGIEIQVLDDSSPKYAKLRPEQYHGSVYDVIPAERGYLKPPGEWNEQEIIANGRQITVKLNGHTIVDANLDQVTDEAKLKKHPGIKREFGSIGLLGHGAEVEFRNMRIKEL